MIDPLNRMEELRQLYAAEVLYRMNGDSRYVWPSVIMGWAMGKGCTEASALALVKYIRGG